MKAITFLINLSILEKKRHPRNPHFMPPLEILGLSPASARMHDLVKALRQILASGLLIIGYTQTEIEWLLDKAASMEICRADACMYDPIARKFPADANADQTAWHNFIKLNYSAR